jgi:hypothetical protein
MDTPFPGTRACLIKLYIKVFSEFLRQKTTFLYNNNNLYDPKLNPELLWASLLKIGSRDGYTIFPAPTMPET